VAARDMRAQFLDKWNWKRERDQSSSKKKKKKTGGAPWELRRRWRKLTPTDDTTPGHVDFHPMKVESSLAETARGRAGVDCSQGVRRRRSRNVYLALGERFLEIIRLAANKIDLPAPIQPGSARIEAMNRLDTK